MSARTSFPPIAAALALAIGCASGCSRPDHEQRRAEVLAADVAFSEKSAKEGPSAAFLAYITPEAILLGEKSARGPSGVHALFDGSPPFPPQASLTWKPLVADVSSSGDLGYTWGRYELHLPGPENGQAAARTGSYVTIWRRQPDGAWKFVLDGGSPDGPPPRPKPSE